MTKVIYLHGAPAVGKLTTAKMLCERTGYKLLHNHLTTDLVRAIFDRGNPRGDMHIVKLRFEMLELALQENVGGVVITAAHASNYLYPNGESDEWYAQKLESITESNSGVFYGVHLIADEEILLKRVVGEDRKKFGKISDVETLTSSIQTNDYMKPALVKNCISINNTNKSVDEITGEIIEFINK